MGADHSGLPIYTVGHSNSSFEEFLSLLQPAHIQAVADVRRYPSSRKFPHFNQTAFEQLLHAQGISYHWFEKLGGWRHQGMGDSSPNAGLETPGFRNYADYMLSDEFRQAAEKLLSIAAERMSAVMCSERLYWRCHRRLLSDYLLSLGMEVIHILERHKTRPHQLTAEAFIGEPGRVVYPAATERG